MVSKRKYNTLILLILTVLSFERSQSQHPSEFHFQRIGLNEGLSQSRIIDIAQDSVGFLWFATQDGLNRYDGYEFKVFRHDDTDSTSISSNYVTALLVTNNGDLLVGTRYGGLNRYGNSQETFTQYPSRLYGEIDLKAIHITSLVEDTEGLIWIATRGNGLFCLEPTNEIISHYHFDPNNPTSLSDNYVRNTALDLEGNLWIATVNGLNRLSVNHDQFIRYRHDPSEPTSLINNTVWNVYCDRTGVIWCSTAGGLSRYDAKDNTFRNFEHDPFNPQSISSNNVVQVFEDKRRNLWVGTIDMGLNIYDRNNNIFHRILHDPTDEESISDITIGPIFEDHGGIIWIGTGIAGLNKFDPDWQRFGHIRRIPVEDGVMHINSVRAIFEDSMDGLWIALDGKGLVYRPANQNAFIHFQAQPGNPTWLSDNFVNRILEWQGEIWIVTRSSGINIYNYTTKQFRRMDNTYLVYEQDRGIHWIWKDGILNKFDTLSGEFVPDTATVGITRLLKSYYVGSLFQDSQRRYWVEIIGEGIIIFNEANGTLRQFKHNPTDRKSISHNDISSVIEDTTGRIWIGTPNGLNRFNEEDTSFSRLTEKEGLPNDYIYSILKDNGGYLWASSNKGIARIDPHSLQIRSYDVSDHLQSNEFNGGAYLRGRNGQLYFGGVAGYNVFHPDSIGQSDFKPPIAITKFIVNDSLPYPITGRGSGSKVILSHIENVFKFEFAALDYANPKSIEYTYMLAGLEDTWVPAGKRRIARYSNVAPGEYTFMVKATNSDGVWNTKTKTIHLTVTPPWWRTKLAYLIYVLLGGTVLYGALQYELNRGRLKQQIEMEHFKAEKLSELDKLKSRFFANISHEFRTPLTLIQGPIESMLSKETRAEEKKQYKMVLRNSHRLQKLVNQLLDLSRIETKQMKLHTTELDIVKTVREIAASFESLAVRNKINFSIDTPDDPIMGWFDRDCVEKIVTNLLANAFKFTSEGDQVILRLQTAIHGDQDSVEITVKDTGIGIPGDQIDKVFDRFYQVDASNMREQEGAGIGLALTKELVELHGGNITVTSEVGESTTFSIKLSAIEKDVTSEETALIEKPPDHRGLDTIEVDEPEKMESPEVRTRDSRHQILIIDDNADMRKYMGSHLETNYRIIEAENGQEGLKKAIKKIPDLIISDVMMPKMDGFALCEKVKTDERSSHIPVILLTAKADSESKLGGLETGADDYLTKPFDPKELQVRIKNLIQQRRRLRQKFMLEASIKPHDLAITSTDEKFLQRAVDLIEEHMSDGKYSIDLFSQEIGMSRMQLHRKLKALTGTSTSGFIRTLRMKHAALLLQQGFGNVAQVAFEVGFNNPSYFSVCFKKQLGKSPTDFIPD